MIVTLLISLIVFEPIPYIPGLIIALPSGKFDPNLLAFASAIGVTLGRTTIFLASYRGRSLIKKGNINSSFLLFLITNLDRGSVIGKRFPWTVEGRISKDDNQMGRLEESNSSCNLFEIQHNSARTIRI